MAAHHHPDASKQRILDQLEATLAELYQTHGEPPVRSIDQIGSAQCQTDLRTYGIYVVGDLTDPVVYEFNLLNLSRELYAIIFDLYLDPTTTTLDTLAAYPNQLFQQELVRIQTKYQGIFAYQGEFILAALTSFWNSNHGFGNSNFRFVYLQYLKDDPTFLVHGIDRPIEFNYNPIHRVDLRLLAYYPPLWDLLKSLYPGGQPMVSWDSQKVRFQDTGKINKIGMSSISKATKPGMTKRHHDIYTYGGQEMDRIQAMLMFQSPHAIALGYVIFSNHPRVRALLRSYFGKERTNFGAVEDEYLNPIIDRYWRAPLDGFVMWEMSTIHYEGLPVDAGPSLRTFGGMKETPESLRTFSFRAVIGTHTPIDLTPRARRELCYLSEKGWLPEIYKHKHNNDNTPISRNLVNVKTTQYLKPRTMGVTEAAILQSTADGYTEAEVDTFVDTLPPILREMYGIYE